jgi:uncharacterized protein (TIGR03435 family)
MGKIVVLAAIWLPSLAAQNARPEFEVASVKFLPEPAPPHGVSLNISHGKASLDAAQLRQIIGLAYGIQRVLVEGGPEWSDTDMFDIVAKAANPDASRDDIRAMLQTLLADRFKLAVHRETKQLPAYVLTVAKGGPNLKVSKDEHPSAFVPVPNGLVFERMGIVGLVNYVANISGRPVQNLTGLTERYDFKLDFTPPEAVTPGSVDLPSLVFAAVERLGLKLESRKAPVEVLVVDHAEHPTAN